MLGICLLTNTSTGNRCIPSADKSPDAVAALLGLNDDQNSLAALRFVLILQKRVVLPYILPIAAGLLMFVAVSMGVWELGHRRNVSLVYVGFAFFSVPSALALVAAVSTSMAPGALVLGSGTVGGPRMVQGTVLQGNEWSAVTIHYVTMASFIALALNRPGMKSNSSDGYLPAGGPIAGPGGPLSI